jgi:predicted RNase H-like HicB family nuclease
LKYKVSIKKSDEGYSIWVPGLPGCWSQGKTEKEALENIKDAIKLYLDTVKSLNRGTRTRYVEVG